MSSKKTTKDDGFDLLQACFRGKSCGKFSVRQQRCLRTAGEVERLCDQLRTKADRLKWGEKLIIEDFDVSETRMPAASWKAILSTISSNRIQVEMLRAFRCPTLDDEVAVAIADWLSKVPQDLCPFELHLSHCAIETKGYEAIIKALKSNKAFPAPNRRRPLDGLSPLYMRLERNYIDESAITADIRDKTIATFYKTDAPIFSKKIKVRLLVREDDRLLQKKGPPPSVEELPPPKPIKSKGKGKSRVHIVYESGHNWDSKSDPYSSDSGPDFEKHEQEDPWSKADPWGGTTASSKGRSTKADVARGSADPPIDWHDDADEPSTTEAGSSTDAWMKAKRWGNSNNRPKADPSNTSSTGADFDSWKWADSWGESGDPTEKSVSSSNLPSIQEDTDPWTKSDPWGISRQGTNRTAATVAAAEQASDAWEHCGTRSWSCDGDFSSSWSWSWSWSGADWSCWEDWRHDDQASGWAAADSSSSNSVWGEVKECDGESGGEEDEEDEEDEDEAEDEEDQESEEEDAEADEDCLGCRGEFPSSKVESKDFVIDGEYLKGLNNEALIAAMDLMQEELKRRLRTL